MRLGRLTRSNPINRPLHRRSLSVTTIASPSSQHHRRRAPCNGTRNLNPKPLGFIEKLENESAIETLHGNLIKSGTIAHLDVGNFVLNGYVKFGILGVALKVFDEMPERDVRSWTILVSGCARAGLFGMGLRWFGMMVGEGVAPNGFTLSSAMKCCSGLVRVGRAVHGWIVMNGIGMDVVLENSVLDFYVKCGEIRRARRVFELMGVKNTITWNVMISGYVQDGDAESSLELFRRLPDKDTETWNTMISGLVHNGLERTALELLYKMVKVGVCFSDYTLSMALAVVSRLMLMELGRQIHAQMMRLEFFDNEFARSSLIDMYSKCNNVDKASCIFRRIPDNVPRRQNSMTDIFCLSAMVSGYVKSRRWKDAIEIFCNMVSKGIDVDKFTMTSIICSCADFGMLELGQQIHSLVLKRGHKLDAVLCSSMVDMYSKCGSLSDAYLMFNQLDDQNVFLWTSIICAFALHGREREAVQLFESMRSKGIPPNEVGAKLLELEPLDQQPYVLVSDLSIAGNKWEESAGLRHLMQKRGVRKQAGQSWTS
ncbi:Pentatricopeptide repeat-containing protein [Drosera capensis]